MASAGNMLIRFPYRKTEFVPFKADQTAYEALRDFYGSDNFKTKFLYNRYTLNTTERMGPVCPVPITAGAHSFVDKDGHPLLCFDTISHCSDINSSKYNYLFKAWQEPEGQRPKLFDGLGDFDETQVHIRAYAPRNRSDSAASSRSQSNSTVGGDDGDDVSSIAASACEATPNRNPRSAPVVPTPATGTTGNMSVSAPPARRMQSQSTATSSSIPFRVADQDDATIPVRPRGAALMAAIMDQAAAAASTPMDTEFSEDEAQVHPDDLEDILQDNAMETDDTIAASLARHAYGNVKETAAVQATAANSARGSSDVIVNVNRQYKSAYSKGGGAAVYGDKATGAGRRANIQVAKDNSAIAHGQHSRAAAAPPSISHAADNVGLVVPRPSDTVRSGGRARSEMPDEVESLIDNFGKMVTEKEAVLASMISHWIQESSSIC